MAQDTHSATTPTEDPGFGGSTDLGGPEGPVPAAGPTESTGGLEAIASRLRGNWILVGLFAAGLASLYLMSLWKGPAAASAEQIQVQSNVEEALSKLIAAPLNTPGGKGTSAIVQTFYYDARQRQIPPDKLRNNPFVFRAAEVRPAPAPVPKVETPATKPVSDATELTEATNAVKTLTLQSVVMGTRRRAAIISNNLLTEGQTIQGWTVTEIQPKEVTLTWKDQKHVLRMSQP